MGRLLNNPVFSNLTGINLTSVFAELYKDDELIHTSYSEKTIFGAPKIIFPKLLKGEYIVKVFRNKINNGQSFIGFGKANITDDTEIDIICTWPKEISIKVTNQDNAKIKDVELVVYINDTIVWTNFTNDTRDTIFTLPFKFLEKYQLKGFYKGFQVLNYEIPIFEKKFEHSFKIYDLNVNIKDLKGFSPGVDVKTYLTSDEMSLPFEINPLKVSSGKYIFENLPKANYELQIEYGSFYEIFPVKIPYDNEVLEVKFGAKYSLKTLLFDSRGIAIDSSEKYLTIYRSSSKIFDSIPADKIISIPPGEYNIYVYADQEKIGFKNVFITNDKQINIVTGIKSIIPNLVTILVIIFIIQSFVLLFFKKISLNSFLKIVAMSLILLSLTSPWWTLYAQDNETNSERSIEMFLIPSSMIEKIRYENVKYLDMANIPELFTDFLEVLVLILCSGFGLIGLSFIPNILYKRRFTFILISASVLFLILFSAAFLFGMMRIAELSLGSLQGSGVLEVGLLNKNVVQMDAVWGLGIGFYLSLIAALSAFVGGFIDFLRNKKIF
jgi:hypothetical protein